MYTTLESKVIYYTESFYYFLFWCLYYFAISEEDNILFQFIQKLPQNKIIEGNSRIVSSSHAVILSFFSTLYLIGIVDYSYWTSYLPICSSFGVFDLSLITYYYSIFKKGYIPTLVHHTLLIFGPMVLTPQNSYLMAQAFLFETTVPILDFNWYLYHINQRNSTLFKTNSLVSILCFLIFRIANNCYLLMHSVKYSLIVQFISLLFLILNTYWFFNLIKLFVKHAL